MSIKAKIYLDANAGVPLSEGALAAILPWLKGGDASACLFFSNPSSIHSHGRKMKKALAEAREAVAGSLGIKVDPEQLVFTSSGTEANQLAIDSVLDPLFSQGKMPHWITTAVEHDSVRQKVEWIENKGGSVSYLPIDADGRPQVERLSEFIRPETALISCVWVNNETGVISNVDALVEEAKRHRIPVHIDAAQAWGKIPLDLTALGAQYVTFSAYKIGALQGVGVLALGNGRPAHANAYSMILGKQEKGRRGGTENGIGIISAGGAALNLNANAWAERVAPIRDRLEKAILSRIPGTIVNGGGAPRVANTLNLSFEGVEGDGLVMAMDLAGYSVSSGSACASGVLEPSHVLLAMGRNKGQAMGAIRISLADVLEWEILEEFVEALSKSVGRVRGRKSGN